MITVYIVAISLILNFIIVSAGNKDECLSKKKVGAIIGNILKKRRGLTITLSPDELEHLVSLRYGCAERQHISIYFSAALKSIYSTKVASEVIKFDDVIVNEGGAYNSTNGLFVCPRTGTYLLSFGFLSNHAKGIHIQLEITGNVLVRLYTPSDARYNSAEKSVPYPLKKGDVVGVRVREAGASLYGNRYTTFSAMYIQT